MRKPDKQCRTEENEHNAAQTKHKSILDMKPNHGPRPISKHEVQTDKTRLKLTFAFPFPSLIALLSLPGQTKPIPSQNEPGTYLPYRLTMENNASEKTRPNITLRKEDRIVSVKLWVSS